MFLTLAGAVFALAINQVAVIPASFPGYGASARVPTQPQSAPEVPTALPHFGLSLDAGLPAGVDLDLWLRPVSFLRVWAGPAFNGLLGGQAGIELSPLNWAITPVLSLEGGKYSDGHYLCSRLHLSESNEWISTLIDDAALGYGAAMFGLELGSQRGFSLDLRVGVAKIYAQASRSGTYSTTVAGQSTSITLFNPSIVAVTPAVKLGFLYWF